jgi:solute carrier family 35 protein E1
MSTSDQITLAVTFIFWYATNASYNVFNNYMKNVFFYPITIASLQLAVGLLYAIPLWILKIRKTPNLKLKDIYQLLPIIFLNFLGHVCSVVAMFQKGGGSFTHVIKASEPVVSVIVGYFMFGTIPKLFTSLSLLPITYGVAYASTLGIKT